MLGLIYRLLKHLKYFVNSAINLCSCLSKLLPAKLISINLLNDKCMLANALSSIWLNDKSNDLMLTIMSFKSTDSIMLFDRFKLDKLGGRCSILVS